jgi:ATP-dependent RNA helicase DeaD
VPTIIDLRARKLELTRASIAEAIAAGDLDQYRVVVEALSSDHDIVDIATAAVRLAHEAQGKEAQGADIPEVAITASRNGRERAAKRDRGARARPERGEGKQRPRKRGGDSDATRLYIGLGRSSGMRPADIVGAIANEAGVDSSGIGAIDIADRFSLVDVPSGDADAIITALRGTKIRGKKVLVRPHRESRPGLRGT